MALPHFPRDDWRRLTPLDRLEPGQVTLAFLDTTRVAITLGNDGELRVFNNSCPHAGAPLSAGKIQEDSIICTRHGWSFNLSDGECPAHPGYALKLYESRIREGWVEARKPEEIW